MRPLSLCVCLLCSLVLELGCSNVIVYRPDERPPLLEKRVAFLDMPVPSGDTSPKLHEIVLRETEKKIAKLPWQKFLTRSEASQHLEKDFLLVEAQRQLAQTITIAGFSHAGSSDAGSFDAGFSHAGSSDAGSFDSKETKGIGEVLEVDLLIGVHFEHVVCPKCFNKHELWMIGHLINAQDNKTMFRSHLRKKFSKDDPAFILKTALKMTDTQTNLILNRLKKRWQLERFRALKERG